MNTPDQQPRQILLVDDDQAFLDMLALRLGMWTHGEWTVHLAHTTARAFAILEAQPMDLVVVDMRMPVMDGRQFLQLLQRKYPQLHKAVLTGLPSEEGRAACLHHGAELFLEKPHSEEEFETVFAMLNELANSDSSEGFQGVLRQVGLTEVLQLECLRRNSSVLEVVNANSRGRIFIHTGSIIHAESGALDGEPAFYHLLGLGGGKFELKPFTAPPARTIEGSWEFLLMEAARLHDEAAENAAGEANADISARADEEETILLFPADATGNPPRNGETPGQRLDPQADGEEPERTVTIEEMLICSGMDNVLYESQCSNIKGRQQLFDLIAERGAAISLLVPLGSSERLEILYPQERMVVQVQEQRRLFIRSRREVAGAKRL